MYNNNKEASFYTLFSTPLLPHLINDSFTAPPFHITFKQTNTHIKYMYNWIECVWIGEQLTICLRRTWFLYFAVISAVIALYSGMRFNSRNKKKQTNQIIYCSWAKTIGQWCHNITFSQQVFLNVQHTFMYFNSICLRHCVINSKSIAYEY